MDLIDRQAAIDALCDNCETINSSCAHYPCKRYLAIENLPSAQLEIIRCKDCVHSDTFPEDADNDTPLKCLGIRYGGVMPDWYCEHAERRTDE